LGKNAKIFIQWRLLEKDEYSDFERAGVLLPSFAHSIGRVRFSVVPYRMKNYD